MQRMVNLVAVVVFALLWSPVAFASEEGGGIDAASAFKLLKEGNAAYVAGTPAHPFGNAARREEVAKGQKPFAIILGCSDSRVPPEVVFDRGLGDLFVIRDAGNIAGDIEIGSMEYAAEHLGTPLIVVLGHERCGAVTAAVKGGEVPGHLISIVDRIQPAVEKTRGAEGDAVDNAVKANVAEVRAKLLSAGPVLKELVEEKKLQVVGAYYDLDTGAVEFIDTVAEPPKEEVQPVAAAESAKEEVKPAEGGEPAKEAGKPAEEKGAGESKKYLF